MAAREYHSGNSFCLYDLSAVPKFHILYKRSSSLLSNQRTHLKLFEFPHTYNLDKPALLPMLFLPHEHLGDCRAILVILRSPFLYTGLSLFVIRHIFLTVLSRGFFQKSNTSPIYIYKILY